jgi:hypothetical protein
MCEMRKRQRVELERRRIVAKAESTCKQGGLPDKVATPCCTLQIMEIRVENQQNSVADEVSALFAVVRPILKGLLYALKADVTAEAGGRENVKLKMLPRLYRPGDGDCGICFEYAVHDAMLRRDPAVLERVSDALTLCHVPGSDMSSILFGAEKTGSQQLIATARKILTPSSQLMYGKRGRPALLQRHINAIAQALRKPTARLNLPQSISGIWRADLFLGKLDTDKWVGTTVKINPTQLTSDKGLRVGIVPVKQGESDAVVRDESRNLVICPLLHDRNFMEVFYAGWIIVQQFIAADARVPGEVNLPRPPEREIARQLAMRREFSVVDVIDALLPLSQPELLVTQERDAQLILTRGDSTVTGAVVAPIGRGPD